MSAIPITAEHPGRLLQRKMAEHEISEAQLADGTGLSRALINQIIMENRRVTPATALLFARFFRMEPEDWIGTQGQFDLEAARNELGDRLASVVPVTKKM